MTQVFEDIKIDAEFAGLIPPLTADEREQLEANISAHGGARDPLVVWAKAGNLTLVDGHNRYEICTRLDLPFEIEEMRFDDRNAAMLWIIDNQKGRRNLADFAMTELEMAREKIYEEITIAAHRPKKDDKKTTQKLEELPDRNDRTKDARIGAAAGVSREQVAKVRRIRDAAKDGLVDEDTLTKLRTGAVSINHVDKTVKKHKAEAKAAERKKEAASAGVIDGDLVRLGDFRTILPSIPDGCVDLIFTDPPYDKETVPLYEDMAREAARILRPGGSLICYLGQYATADVCRLVGGHLKFLWPLCCYHEGPGQVMAFWGIRVKWKPMLWFVNGGNRFDTSAVVEDLIVSTKEKSSHPWQQSVVEARYYIEKLTPKGGLVVDPFCGGGTTAVAAKLSGRKWITCELDPEYAAIATKRIKEA
jgi:hypothetical protein